MRISKKDLLKIIRESVLDTQDYSQRLELISILTNFYQHELTIWFVERPELEDKVKMLIENLVRRVPEFVDENIDSNAIEFVNAMKSEFLRQNVLSERDLSELFSILTSNIEENNVSNFIDKYDGQSELDKLTYYLMTKNLGDDKVAIKIITDSIANSFAFFLTFIGYENVSYYLFPKIERTGLTTERNKAIKRLVDTYVQTPSVQDYIFSIVQGTTFLPDMRRGDQVDKFYKEIEEVLLHDFLEFSEERGVLNPNFNFETLESRKIPYTNSTWLDKILDSLGRAILDAVETADIY